MDTTSGMALVILCPSSGHHNRTQCPTHETQENVRVIYYPKVTAVNKMHSSQYDTFVTATYRQVMFRTMLFYDF